MAAVQVMIVEDQHMLAVGLRRRLQRLGYAVSDQATTGEEAVIKALDGEHDIILMDIRLQGSLDGIEAAKRIRAQCSIPIVYATAYADEETVARAASTRPDGYVMKPYDDADLKRAIDFAVSKPVHYAAHEPAPTAPASELIHQLTNELTFVRCSLESLGLEGPLSPAQEGLVHSAIEHLVNVVAAVSALQQPASVSRG